MRFMVIVKATPQSEAGELGEEALYQAMHAHDQELVNAGVMLAADGLQPSRQGARVRFQGSGRTVVNGPFPETRQLVAGFWLWKVASMEEALQWLKRAPFQDAEVELRPIQEVEDLAVSDEVRRGDQDLRRQLEKRSNAFMAEIAWKDFDAVELRVGTVVRAEPFPEARKPALKLWIDLGPELGVKRSSAQITALYRPETLVGKQVLCVTNFPPRQVGPFMSEVLTTGFYREAGVVVLAVPDQPVPNGERLI